MLKKISVQGFKSIERQTIELGALNVLVGANGSGKSNLIGVFYLLECVLTHNLQLYVASEPDRFLFHGRKTTPRLSIDFDFEINAYYAFVLKAVRDSLIFERELVFENGSLAEENATGAKESLLVEDQQFSSLFMSLENLEFFHLQDTADSSPARKAADIDDNRFFRADAANLPAYLYWLQEKHPVEFRHIEEHIRLVAPFFERFVLAPSKSNEKKIKLEWRQKGSDAYFDAYSLSDGTLRFICLATLLLQPNPPALILLDEPELGLHPLAIRILAEMLEVASKRVQIILATQSVTLLDDFAPQDVIVAENEGLKTTFKRLDVEKLKIWLDDFSLGELWEKNVLGGRP
jgi:predicted ATPase